MDVRDERMDAIRGIGVILIVLLHVAAPHFAAYGSDWWSALAYSSLARPGVPLFLMLSGAFLLDVSRRRSVSSILRKMPRYAIPLFFWSVVYGIWKFGIGEPVSIANAFLGIPVMYHLWYLYVALGLLVTTPILGLIAAAERDIRRYYVSVWALTMCLLLPLGAHFGVVAIEQLYGLSTFAGYSGFLVLGAILYSQRSSLPGASGAWLAGTLGSIVSIAASTAWISAQGQRASEEMFVYTSLPVVASSICMFVYLLIVRLPSRFEHLSAKLGSVSLGVFGSHLLVMFFLWYFFRLSVGSFSTWIGIPVMTAIVVAISAGIATILRLSRFGRMVA